MIFRTFAAAFICLLLAACQNNLSSLQPISSPVTDRATACFKSAGALDSSLAMIKDFYINPIATEPAYNNDVDATYRHAIKAYVTAIDKCKVLKTDALTDLADKSAYNTYYKQIDLIVQWLANGSIDVEEAIALKNSASNIFNTNPYATFIGTKYLDNVKQILASNDALSDCKNKIRNSASAQLVDKEIFFKHYDSPNKSSLLALNKQLTEVQKSSLRQFIILDLECIDIRLLTLTGLPRFQSRSAGYYKVMDSIYSKLLNDEITIGEANTEYDRARNFWLIIKRDENEVS